MQDLPVAQEQVQGPEQMAVEEVRRTGKDTAVALVTPEGRGSEGQQVSERIQPSADMIDPSTVTFEQAMSYAMSAQYMAGYWMGVAQSRRAKPDEESNIFVTKHVA
jgi:hypothetical protein